MPAAPRVAQTSLSASAAATPTSDVFAAADHRLKEFLIQRYGGPDRYSQSRGHPRLRMRHSPFPIDKTARDRWITLMESALAESNLPPEAAPYLRHFFDATATFMI